MLKAISVLIIVLFFSSSFGQYAVLKDKDGFINVSEKGDLKSEITDTFHSGKIVFFLFELNDPPKPEGEWYPIEFSKKG
jgi:hypothetical protein